MLCASVLKPLRAAWSSSMAAAVRLASLAAMSSREQMSARLAEAAKLCALAVWISVTSSPGAL
eukprot:6200-Heterococcus_DN1.PRE.1